MSSWRSQATAVKARALLCAVSEHDFVVAMLTMRDILSITKPLSESLQKTNMDLIACVEEITNAINVLKEKRQTTDSDMSSIAVEAEKLLGEELKSPRCCKHQIHRSNVSSDSAVQYFSRSVYIPFLDGIISDLSERFAKHNATALRISALIPSHIENHTFADVEPLVEFYHSCVSVTTAELKGEYERWVKKWKTSETKPSCPAETLQSCFKDAYPAIHSYLTIFCVIPATTASAERTFSTLKFLKSYLRSTMSECRLNGLTRMFLRRDIPIDTNNVIESFGKKKRRLDFILS